MIQMQLKEFGKPGAQVRVYTESELMSPSTTGTIHQITNEELFLRNCITRAAVPTPDGQLQCQTTHTPEMSFAIHDLTDFTCLVEASNRDSATQSNQELSAVIGVIYRDGRQQTWGSSFPRTTELPPVRVRSHWAALACRAFHRSYPAVSTTHRNPVWNVPESASARMRAPQR